MVRLVAFEIITPSKSFLAPQSFLKLCEFSDDIERQYVRQFATQAVKGKTRFYLLVERAKLVGFISLSVATLSELPCIVIDYLFTTRSYRGISVEELGNRKISGFLVDHAILTAISVNSFVPIRFVALLPVHKKLEGYYNSLGFHSLDRTFWMFQKL